MKYGRPVDNKAVRVASATVPIVINGDGAYSGAPAKDEDAQYPMSHLYSQDRYRVWSTKVGNADTAIKVQIDLTGGANGAGAGGADVAISSAALQGLRGHAGTTPPASVAVGYRTRAQGYSATTYTSAGTITTSGERDSVLEFGQVSARYWELNFTSYNAAGFALGSFWLGVLNDFGIFWSAGGGAAWADEHNVLLSRTAGGHLSGVARGDAWAQYTLTFRAIDNTKRATLLSHFGAAQRAQPLLLLDENNVPRQFMVMGGPQFSQVFGGVYDATVNLERLG
jgi:hypothetical protein